MFDLIILDGKTFRLNRNTGETWLPSNNKWVSIK